MATIHPPVDRALGIHDHPRRKLGRRPRNIHRPAVKLASILRPGVLPGHPIAVDHLVPPAGGSLGFGLYRNDEFGDCGPVSVANHRRLATSWLTSREEVPTIDDVFGLYRRSGNPEFDPETDADDNGVNMQTMLEVLHLQGLGPPGRATRCVAFASVDVAHPEELRAAEAYFGGALLGVTLEVAQQDQHGAWTYKPSSPWGGHAVVGGAYDRRATSGDLAVISWGERFVMSRSFVSRQLDEAWVVIWPEMLGSRQFLDGVDLDALRNAYRDITGRALP